MRKEHFDLIKAALLEVKAAKTLIDTGLNTDAWNALQQAEIKLETVTIHAKINDLVK